MCGVQQNCVICKFIRFSANLHSNEIVLVLVLVLVHVLVHVLVLVLVLVLVFVLVLVLILFLGFFTSWIQVVFLYADPDPDPKHWFLYCF